MTIYAVIQHSSAQDHGKRVLLTSVRAYAQIICDAIREDFGTDSAAELIEVERKKL